MTEDAVTVAPEHYKVVLETDRVRVLEFSAPPGDKTQMHTHPDQVAVGIAGADYRFYTPDGQVADVALETGQVFFVEAVEHATEITGTRQARAIVVELK